MHKNGKEPGRGILYDVEKTYPDGLHDESHLYGHADSVSFPINEGEIQEHLSRMPKQPVTLQAMRTGLNGGSVPFGGHIINLTRMNRILGIRRDGDAFFLRMQPGVLMREQIWPATVKKEIDPRGWSPESLKVLEEYKKGGGYFFPPDPSEPTISIGGMVANNSKGARSFRYGAVRDHVEGLRVVLADGAILHLRRGDAEVRNGSFSIRTEAGRRISGRLPTYPIPEVKDSSGYYVREGMDLIDLFIGSEGTLGVISEVEVRLARAPASMWGIMVFLPSEREAVRFVQDMRDSESKPAALELLDSRSLDIVRKSKKTFEQYQLGSEIPEGTAVYVEIHGASEREAEDAVGAMAEKLTLFGGSSGNTWAGSGERDVTKFKQIRHLLPELINGMIAERQKNQPGITKLATDFAVPNGELDRIMAMYHERLEEGDFEYLYFGHIGDNNIHVNILPRSLDDFKAGKELYLDWARQVVEMGGSISAEHGIGKLKRNLLEVMRGSEGVAQMRAVKETFDPNLILNQGNIFLEA